MSGRLRGGFAQFDTKEVCEQFANRVFAAQPSLREHAYLSSSRPQIVFENLDDHQLTEVQSALSGVGRWFDDVQFTPFP